MRIYRAARPVEPTAGYRHERGGDIRGQRGAADKGGQPSRIDGWLAVKEYLRAEDGEPKLRIFSTCAPLLRTLPLLQHDPKKPGDAATKPHDVTHSPDALRYWCSRRQNAPLPVREEAAEAFKPRQPKGDMEGYLMGGYPKM